MPFSSSLLRVSLVLVLLHGGFVSSALRAEPEEEKVAAAAAAPAAPSAECAKRFPRLSFGLKTLFFGMTLAAFLAVHPK